MARNSNSIIGAKFKICVEDKEARKEKFDRFLIVSTEVLTNFFCAAVKKDTVVKFQLLKVKKIVWAFKLKDALSTC